MKGKKAAKEAVRKTADKLTPKQTEFVGAYLANGLNATQAAISAGYSERTAESQGSRLLKNVKVAAAIADVMRTRLEKREITSERILDEIHDVAFWRYGRIDDGLPEVKTKDKLKGLELLGRYKKLFTDKVEVTHKIQRVLVKEAVRKHRPLPPAKPEFEKS